MLADVGSSRGQPAHHDPEAAISWLVRTAAALAKVTWWDRVEAHHGVGEALDQ